MLRHSWTVRKINHFQVRFNLIQESIVVRLCLFLLIEFTSVGLDWIGCSSALRWLLLFTIGWCCGWFALTFTKDFAELNYSQATTCHITRRLCLCETQISLSYDTIFTISLWQCAMFKTQFTVYVLLCLFEVYSRGWHSSVKGQTGRYMKIERA